MLKRRIIVNISDVRVSGNPSDVLVTYSLGSCIAVCLYDPAINIGGMLHYQLPDSKMDPERARNKPGMFADTGLEIRVEKLTTMGSKKERMQVRIAGGASMVNGPNGLNIGKRIHLTFKKTV